MDDNMDALQDVTQYHKRSPNAWQDVLAASRVPSWLKNLEGAEYIIFIK